jgi:hypothetical protein
MQSRRVKASSTSFLLIRIDDVYAELGIEFFVEWDRFDGHHDFECGFDESLQKMAAVNDSILSGEGNVGMGRGLTVFQGDIADEGCDLGVGI